MKKVKSIYLFKPLWLLLLFILPAMNSCLEKNLYVELDKKEPVVKEDYFSFLTSDSIDLTVDYGFPEYKLFFEVYTEYPLDYIDGNVVKKDEAKSIFGIYTDKDSRYSGKMGLPSSIRKVFLYTDALGVPQCVELEVVNKTVTFEYTRLPPSTKASMRSMAAGEHVPYLVSLQNKLYSLSTWEARGVVPNGYASVVGKIGGKETGDLLRRLTNTLQGGTNVNNSKYIRTEEVTNIRINETTSTGAAVTGARIDLIFLCEFAWHENTLGYYYYKTGTKPNASDLPKYIVFPNVSTGMDKPYQGSGVAAPLGGGGIKARLQFFGEDYAGAPNEVFPPGYSIGWFLIPAAFGSNSNYNTSACKTGTSELDANKTFLYSNSRFNAGGKSRCITLYDEATNKMVVGFEDGSNSTFNDALFCIDADPISAIINPDIPLVDDNPTNSDKVVGTSGTLAFEDIWPNGGDYDMNDVVIEYSTEVTINDDNKVLMIADKYISVHDGASFNDAFGYQIRDYKQGTPDVTVGSPQGARGGQAVWEKEQNFPTIILFENINATTPKDTFIVFL